jgi:hypothetical protein
LSAFRIDAAAWLGERRRVMCTPTPISSNQ